jgi:PAS domain S-box-containing protein
LSTRDIPPYIVGLLPREASVNVSQLKLLRLAFVALLGAVAVGLAPVASAAAGEPVQVLYLNSYDQQMNWAQDIARGMTDVLQPEASNIVLHVFNLDSKRFHSPEYFAGVRDLFRIKYGQTRFALILCSDNNAYDFARENRELLFRGVPIVFCGVNDFQDEEIRGVKAITGVAEIFSARETVELIQRLHPDTREIFIVNDYLESGRKSALEIDEEIAPLAGSVRFTHNEDLPIEELKARIASLKPGSVVLLGVYYADRDGLAFTFEKAGEALTAPSRVPVYCLHAFYVGHGAVGGKVISGYSQGYAMGLRAKRVLGGEDPLGMPVGRADANQFIFDSRQLSRFGIPEAKLPPGSLVLHRPYSVYQAYRVRIWAVMGFILLLLAAVLALVSTLALRRRTERELRISEERFRLLTEASWEGILLHEGGVALRVNRMFLEMFGREAAEVEDKDVLPLILAPHSLAEVQRRIVEASLEPYEVQARRKDGSEFPAEFRVRCVEFQGRELRMVAIRDLTEQRGLEERLTQAQKMEAIGTLAGGIAHDFNNILSAIFGYTDLLLMDAPEGSEMRASLEQLMKAATRARDLVRQILTFSRHTKRVEEAVPVASIVNEAIKMLRATLPSTIEIQCEARSDAQVFGDPTQIHQVLVNLCTNAALAMRENGGVLEVSLSEVAFDEETSAFYQGLRPGRFLLLSVSDTGCGMEPEVLRRIFEPFFTTRPQGQGTGLGLSVVHGIVQGLGGRVLVYSEPGKGTTFKVFLPVLEAPERGAAEPQAPLPRGHERILFVDDEPFQVDLASRMLGRLGYHMVVLTSSEEALAQFQASPWQFDLLITDMTMPRMSGDVLIERIHAIRSDLPVILCTGFSERITKDRVASLGIQGFAMKPFALEEIALKIRAALAKEPA